MKYGKVKQDIVVDCKIVIAVKTKVGSIAPFCVLLVTQQNNSHSYYFLMIVYNSTIS